MIKQVLSWLSMAVLFAMIQATARSREPWDAAVICRGSLADGSMAFPDICRLKNGEIMCVFYSGFAHTTSPSDRWPRCGRIMAIRSKDEGMTWSKPAVIMDTPDDDRDPSLTCLADGTLLMNWFALVPAKTPAREPWSAVGLLISHSSDSGRTWSAADRVETGSGQQFACSSPIRQLSDGSLLLALYCEGAKGTFGATIKSGDGGKTWKDLALIGEKSGLHLDAETDVVALKDGRLLAALRSSSRENNLYQSESSDRGMTWAPVRLFGFSAHCPYFLRHNSGVILLGCRLTRPTSKIGDQTALYWTADEGKTWKGPFTIDTCGGGYPSMVDLGNREVYCVYYDGGDEKGEGSNIRGKRLRLTPKGVEVLSARQPKTSG